MKNQNKKELQLPERYLQLLTQLKTGKENSITVDKIISNTNGAFNRRDVFAIKHDLIMRYGYPIGSSREGEHKGFYLIKNDNELVDTVRPLQNEAQTMFNLSKKLIENYQNTDNGEENVG
ncbi:hypothetical protein [Priestia aryabhattai]|uniref:hypothetical protein n=1 Tax=Priestia aryabhattai TaxID=412384 RepID=UPI002E1CD9BA|nr:hypothetical protein [Priestia aryabhattai]